MGFQRITRAQRIEINELWDRAHKAGLKDATFSQILKYTKKWEDNIRQAEAEQAKERAELKAAEAEAARQAAETENRGEDVDAATLITALRKAGMTVRQIATAIGVHTSTVYRWARGVFAPIPSRRAALAALAI